MSETRPQRKQITTDDICTLIRHHVADACRIRLRGDVTVRMRFNDGGIERVFDTIERNNPLNAIPD